MSDTVTASALSMLSEHHNPDHSVRFLRQLTEFSLEQCSHFVQLIVDQQKTGNRRAAVADYVRPIQGQQVI